MLDGIRRWALVLVLCCFVLFVPVLAPSGAQEPAALVVMAENPVKGGDVGKARSQAVQKALAVAVDQMLLQMLPTEKAVANLPALAQLTRLRLNEFVQTYRVLSEAAVEGRYVVLVEATLIRSQLKEQLMQLGVMTDGQQMPAALLMIAENALGTTETRYWWAPAGPVQELDADAAVSSKMMAAGIGVLDPARLPAAQREWLAGSGPDPDLSAAAQVTLAAGGKLLVVGRARSDLAANTVGGQQRTFRATVFLKALNAEDGQTLATVSRSATSLHADPAIGSRAALLAAAGQAGEALALKMTRAWQQANQAAAGVEMIVKGTEDLALFVHFRKVLQTLPGVEQVETRELRAGQAVLRVLYQGETSALVDAILLQSFESFGVNIFNQDAQRIGVELIDG